MDLSKLTTVSYQNFATNYFLTKDMMAQYINHYVTDKSTKLEALAMMPQMPYPLILAWIVTISTLYPTKK